MNIKWIFYYHFDEHKRQSFPKIKFAQLNLLN